MADMKKIITLDVLKTYDGLVKGHVSTEVGAAKNEVSGALNSAVTEINGKIEAAEESIEGLGSDLEGVSARVKAIEDNPFNPTGLESSISNHESRIGTLEGTVAGLHNYDDSELRGEISGLKTTVGTLATKEELSTAISGEVSRADGKYEEKGVAQSIVDGLKLSETYATKSEVEGVDAKFANYRKSVDQDVIDNEIKGSISSLTKTVSDNKSELETKIATAEGNAKTYAAEAISGLKTELLGPGATEALDTIAELATALETHADEYDALLEVVGAKATKEEHNALVEEVNKKANKTDVEAEISRVEGKVNAWKQYDDSALKGRMDDAEEALSTVDSRISTAVSGKADRSELGNYYTKTEIEGKGYAVASEVEADIKEVDDKFAGYYTKEEINGKVETINGAIELKADKTELANYHTVAAFNTAIADYAKSADVVATSTYTTDMEAVNAAIDGKVATSDYNTRVGAIETTLEGFSYASDSDINGLFNN